MNRTDRFIQRNRKVTQARRGVNDTVGNQEYAALRDEGWKMTDDTYETYKAEESEFNSGVKDARGLISDARSTNDDNQYAVNKASKALKTTSLASEWKTYQKGFSPVRVIDHNGNVEGTYYLPKSTVNAMDSSINKTYWGNWVNNGTTYNVTTDRKGGAGSGGQEIHDALRNGAQSVKSKFYTKNSGAVKSHNTSVAEGKAQAKLANTNLKDERASLTSEEGLVNDKVALRKSNVKKVADDYSTGLAGRRSLMKTSQ